jgi:hypothetical protein
MTHKITQDVKRERSLFVGIFFNIYTKFPHLKRFLLVFGGKKELVEYKL